MPFVKLDCGMVDSTIWIDREAREVFITALLMAIPREFSEPCEQIAVDEITMTGFTAPPGWYGFVEAAGPGIVRRAAVPQDAGMEALRRLGDADPASRSQEFSGRRMIRIDGGYLILNFMRYRDRDYGAAERMRKLRARRKSDVTPEHTLRSPEQLHIAESRGQRTDADKTKKEGRAYALPAWLDEVAWTEWEAFRKESKKSMTPRTIKSQLKFLHEHLADHPAIIEQSIRNGWQGLFELKGGQGHKLSAVERVMLANRK